MFTFVVWAWTERARWHSPVRELAAYLRSVRKAGMTGSSGEFPTALGPLAAEVAAIYRAARRAAAAAAAASAIPDGGSPGPGTGHLDDAQRALRLAADEAGRTRRISSCRAITRRPTWSIASSRSAWRWIESSPAEQEFLGWTLTELRAKSFLDIVHPDDRGLAMETFLQALERGEALGLVLRIRTAQGKLRSIEINAGARYGTDQRVMHLRCHVTDITAKVRAERALRIRTRELTRVNEQLRRINRELHDLKDRYSDLYENAPAMYFSLDHGGDRDRVQPDDAHVARAGTGRGDRTALPGRASRRPPGAMRGPISRSCSSGARSRKRPDGSSRTGR